jgi:hypothetical protein
MCRAGVPTRLGDDLDHPGTGSASVPKRILTTRGANNHRMPVPRKSLFRCLGEFFGHLRHAARLELKDSAVVRHETMERQEGNMVLRRTIIEEVEIRPERHDGQPGPPAASP